MKMNAVMRCDTFQNFCSFENLFARTRAIYNQNELRPGNEKEYEEAKDWIVWTDERVRVEKMITMQTAHVARIFTKNSFEYHRRLWIHFFWHHYWFRLPGLVCLCVGLSTWAKWSAISHTTRHCWCWMLARFGFLDAGSIKPLRIDYISSPK